MARSQPTIVGRRVFVGSQTGAVYSLDTDTGCTRWGFQAGTGFRAGVTMKNPGVCSRVCELHEALAERIVEVEISNRNVRVAALQKRWDRLSKAFDELLDQRGADMAEIPGGATGMLCKDYKGKDADQLVTKVDTGVLAMSAELRALERQAAEELAQWKVV